MADDRFDGLFLNLAQQSQGIEPLLDNLFGFLRRKTDFYNGASLDKIDEIVSAAIRKHHAINEQEKKVKDEKRKAVEKKKLAKKKAEEAAAKKEDDVMELSEDGSFDATKAPTPKPTIISPPSVTTPEPMETVPPVVPPTTGENGEEEDKTPPRKSPSSPSFPCFKYSI